MKNEITIDMLSVGDEVYYVKQKIVVTVTKTMLDILKTLNVNITNNISRIPCTAPKIREHEHYEYVMCPDGVIREPSHVVYSIHGKGDYFQFDDYRDIPVCDCVHPLQKELAEHLAKQHPKEYATKEAWKMMEIGYTFKRTDLEEYIWYVKDGNLYWSNKKEKDHKVKNGNIDMTLLRLKNYKWIVISEPKQKPLFSDAAVGDLVRFSNWQVCEIVKVDHDSFSIKEDKKHNFPNNRYVYLKTNGKCWANPSKPIHATDLIKKGSAEWAWEMMEKGNLIFGIRNRFIYEINNGFARNTNTCGKWSKEEWLYIIAPDGWQLYEPKPSTKLDELEDRMFFGISITSNGKRIDPLKIYVDESENKNPRTKSMTKQQRTDLFNKGKKVGFKAGYEQGRFDEQAETKPPTYDEVKAAYESGYRKAMADIQDNSKTKENIIHVETKLMIPQEIYNEIYDMCRKKV